MSTPHNSSNRWLYITKPQQVVELLISVNCHYSRCDKFHRKLKEKE